VRIENKGKRNVDKTEKRYFIAATTPTTSTTTTTALNLYIFLSHTFECDHIKWLPLYVTMDYFLITRK